MSLIDTWLAAGKDAGFETNVDILGELNRVTGLNIQTNRIYEWRNGVQRPPVEVTNYMLRICVLYALKQLRPRIRLTDDDICVLADMLSIPESERK